MDTERTDKMRKLFTSESVTEGHPDKVCDQISDAILDEMLRQDPAARVACECCATTGLVMIMGEITANGECNMEKIARQVIRDIGYNDPRWALMRIPAPSSPPCTDRAPISPRALPPLPIMSRARATRA